jgi:predicted metal-dependent phosphoesterase TrpH
MIADRLAAAGAPIDVEALMEAAKALGGKSLARPQIAQALMAAGHVSSVAEAFERFLGEDGPAYVPHHGASPSDVIELINRAGGLSSLAHPGYTKKDEIIPELVASGLGAIEAFHSSHDEAATQRYVEMARHYDVAISGGSDFHGEGTRRSEFFGKTQLPQDEYLRFLERAGRTRESVAGR